MAVAPCACALRCVVVSALPSGGVVVVSTVGVGTVGVSSAALALALGMATFRGVRA